jgi:PAS domain S-box-containing protein
MARTLLAAHAAAPSLSPLARDGAARRRAALAVASVLFVLVTLLRIRIDGLDTPIAMLYVFPIAVLALEFQIVGGVLAGIVSSATFLGWVASEDLAFSDSIWMRVVILIGIGAVIGWISRERQREGAIARAVLEAMPEPASVKDLSGRYLLTNPALERMLQRAGSEIVGTNRPVGQTPDTERRVAEADRRVIETGEPVELEIAGALPDLGERTMRTVKAPVKDAAGRVIAIVTFAHDISARVQHEREVIAMGEQARREYERAIDDYRRLMRHRVANPLTILEGAAATLRLPFAGEETNRAELARLISDQVARLAQLDVGVETSGPEEQELDARASADLAAIRRRAATHADTIRPLTGR